MTKTAKKAKKASPSLQQLESAAIAVMQRAAADHLPVDAGNSGNLAGIVRGAYVAGEERERAVWRSAAQEVLKSYQTFLDADDLEALRDALTELQELVTGEREG